MGTVGHLRESEAAWARWPEACRYVDVHYSVQNALDVANSLKEDKRYSLRYELPKVW